MWPLRNLIRLFDIIAPKTKWLSFKDSLSVIWRFTKSIPLKYINPNNASISTPSVFLTHVCLLHSLKLLLRCKRAIVSLILVFVQSTILSMVSSSKYNGKYLWCLQYCFLWSLGQDNLFYPKWCRIFAVYQWPLDALSSINFLCVFVFLWTKITKKYFQNTIFVHMYDFFVIVFI